MGRMLLAETSSPEQFSRLFWSDMWVVRAGGELRRKRRRPGTRGHGGVAARDHLRLERQRCRVGRLRTGWATHPGAPFAAALWGITRTQSAMKRSSTADA
jgi:hypothetical protein